MHDLLYEINKFCSVLIVVTYCVAVNCARLGVFVWLGRLCMVGLSLYGWGVCMVGVFLYGWGVYVWLGCFCMVGVSLYGWGVSVWLGCLCMVG